MLEEIIDIVVLYNAWFTRLTSEIQKKNGSRMIKVLHV